VAAGGQYGPTFVGYDHEFEDVVGPHPWLELVAQTDAHEGPVYAADEHALYFTTTRKDRVSIKRLGLLKGGLRTVVDDANTANGMAMGHDGRLVVCEQGGQSRPARIVRVDRATGAVETVIADVGGRPLNSPNDVAITSDGAIWFTDPTYGWLQGFRPRPQLGDMVYRIDPASGVARPVVALLDKPNGLAFSPDERTLYVGDSGAIHGPGDYNPRRPRRVLAFGIHGVQPVSRRLFADAIPGFPDGLKVDTAGRVYTSASGGVMVFASDGRTLGEIVLPGAVNFTFGGPGRNVLYITADSAVWAASLRATGASPTTAVPTKGASSWNRCAHAG
jgi:gluconolactonase